ncbi:MAG: hypothetical protein IKZ90_01525 [Clostridiales bacterium]|nr:hypothetical protein [Clostridiales bacterium]
MDIFNSVVEIYKPLIKEYHTSTLMALDFNTKIFINRFKPALERINNRESSFEEISEILLEINSVIKNNDLGKKTYIIENVIS